MLTIKQIKQSFRSNSPNRFCGRAHSGQGWVQKGCKRKIIETDYCNFFWYLATMLLQGSQDSNCSVVVSGKYSIKITMLGVLKKIIHRMVGNITLKIAVQYQAFIKVESVDC